MNSRNLSNTYTPGAGYLVAAIAIGLLSASIGHAAVIVSHIDDALVTDTDSGEGLGVNTETHFVGDSGALSSQTNASAIMYFLLPTLAPGETIISADFQVTLLSNSGNTTAGNDLYALGVLGSPYAVNAIPNALHYESDTADASVGLGIGTDMVERVMDDFAVSSDTGALLSTDASADTALLNFIVDLYANHGVTGGEYLVLRLNPDAVLTSNQDMRYASANNTSSAIKPTLTLDTAVIVPAPAALPAGLALLVMTAMRRRRAA